MRYIFLYNKTEAFESNFSTHQILRFYTIFFYCIYVAYIYKITFRVYKVTSWNPFLMILSIRNKTSLLLILQLHSNSHNLRKFYRINISSTLQHCSNLINQSNIRRQPFHIIKRLLIQPSRCLMFLQHKITFYNFAPKAIHRKMKSRIIILYCID